MTEELLSEVVGKMNEACEGKVKFTCHRRVLEPGERGEPEWWVYRNLSVEEIRGLGARSPVGYSPKLTLCQLVDWCEAWLKGFAEAKGAYENAGGSVPAQ